jgi:hypothetical protein
MSVKPTFVQRRSSSNSMEEKQNEALFVRQTHNQSALERRFFSEYRCVFTYTFVDRIYYLCVRPVWLKIFLFVVFLYMISK